MWLGQMVLQLRFAEEVCDRPLATFLFVGVWVVARPRATYVRLKAGVILFYQQDWLGRDVIKVFLFI